MKTSRQYGFARTDFEVANQNAFMIIPHSYRVESRPWVWCAPVITGREPDAPQGWMLQKLLEKGFAVAGVDVGETFGSPYGRNVYAQFYDYITEKFGLSKKACLLPRSRGGLMLYNWGIEHSQAVLCVAGIYPVSDLRSYPGLEKAAPAYAMTTEELQDILSQHNPIDRIAPLAQAGVPILHIHGDHDEVVPLEQNSTILAKRYCQAGGDMTMLIIQHAGHDYNPGFFRNPKLIDFFCEIVKQ